MWILHLIKTDIDRNRWILNEAIKSDRRAIRVHLISLLKFLTIRRSPSSCAFISTGNSKSGMNIGVRISAGITTGALAVMIAQPTDVVKIRMQAGNNGRSSVKYSSTLQAYKSIANREGARGLWKGKFSFPWNALTIFYL